MNILLSVYNYKLIHYVYDGDKYYIENGVFRSKDYISLEKAIEQLDYCIKIYELENSIVHL